jgi:hypothetical protein
VDGLRGRVEDLDLEHQAGSNTVTAATREPTAQQDNHAGHEC